MGAYLYYKLEDKNKANEASDFLTSITENKMLMASNLDVSLNCQKSIDFFQNNKTLDKSQKKYFISYYEKYFGYGDYKTSGIDPDMLPTNVADIDAIFELLTTIFVKLNQKFKMKYYLGSCAFRTSEDYFSIQQMKAITQNGYLFSGKKKFNEKYNQLMRLFTTNKSKVK